MHGNYDVTNSGQAVSSWTGPSVWPPANTSGPFVGEVGYNMSWLLGSTVDGIGYDISFDSAPSFYIDGQPQALDANGNVVVNSTLRDFEKAAAGLNAFDPYVSTTQLTPVARYLVDGPTLKAIHMINADPQRTMPFTMFAVPDLYFQTYTPCKGSSQGCLNDAYAWIHGDYSDDIGRTWLGMAGPGVKAGGIDSTTWTDHTDIVPTINALTGLKPDYQPDGRVITQILAASVDAAHHSNLMMQLGAVYKQLNAPYGDFANSLIIASTAAIKSDDATYQSIETQIQSLTAKRDALAQRMKDVLNSNADGSAPLLINAGSQLLTTAATLAGK